MSKINKKLLYLDEIFPIGKTEIFFDNNDHSNYMGFTWQRTAVGKAIVGIDPNDSDFNQIGKTGGSKYLQEHSHGLRHGIGSLGSGTQWVVDAGSTTNPIATAGNNAVVNAGTGNSGNLQPYEVFAIWVRIA